VKIIVKGNARKLALEVQFVLFAVGRVVEYGVNVMENRFFGYFLVVII
jgi:hypothetical protein